MNITLSGVSTLENSRNALIGKLFKEGIITMDEMLLLLGVHSVPVTYIQSPQITPAYPENPYRWNPWEVTCKNDVPFTLTGTGNITVSNTTLKN